MALVTRVIDGAGLEHFAAFAAVCVVTGDASHFHDPMLGAEQMGGALVDSLALIGVAAEARVLDGRATQHPFGQLGV